MLIVDDILLSPVRSLMWVFRELHNAAQEQIANEAEAITNELSELYMQLETENITEGEFDEREKVLLDRLDEIEDQKLRSEEDNDA